MFKSIKKCLPLVHVVLLVLQPVHRDNILRLLVCKAMTASVKTVNHLEKFSPLKSKILGLLHESLLKVTTNDISVQTRTKNINVFSVRADFQLLISASLHSLKKKSYNKQCSLFLAMNFQSL